MMEATAGLTVLLYVCSVSPPGGQSCARRRKSENWMTCFRKYSDTKVERFTEETGLLLFIFF